MYSLMQSRSWAARPRPDYSVSHLLKRFSTSSCDRVPLARASSMPAVHLIEDVEMVLNVFDGDVVRQPIQ